MTKEVRSIADYSFKVVWRDKSDEVREEALEMWNESGLLSRGEAVDRLEQMAVAVYYGQKLIGISTIYKSYITQLKSHAYVFRCMILPAFRAPGLDTQLIVKTRDFLETSRPDEEDGTCVGMLMIVRNDTIRKVWRKAIWPGTEMVYIGDTPQGDQMRIYYFKGAEV